VKCKRRRQDGEPCGAQAVAGTDSCKQHAGRPLVEQKARGQVVLELQSWGLDDQLIDSTSAMLRLLAQAYRRAGFYSQLLEEAYEAADRLRKAEFSDLDEPPNAGNSADRDRAMMDLERIFNTGGVASLIGHTYASSGGELGGVFAAGEAIRALVVLEAQERDRAFRFAKECRAADLDGRLVALAEEQGRLVAQVIKASFAVMLDRLTALGLPGELQSAWPELIRTIVPAQLRALGPGEAAA